MELLLVLLGAAISLGTVLITERLREERAERRGSAVKQREVAEANLPEVLELIVAARWQLDEIERDRNAVQWDNPYPDPQGGFPGTWYPQMLRLAHSTVLGDDVRTPAAAIQRRIEEWRAIVHDPDIGERVAKDILADAEALATGLEEAGTWNRGTASLASRRLWCHRKPPVRP